MIKLRLYQEQLIKDSRKEFANGKKHVICQAPTGAGKTVVFSELARQVSQKGKKVLVLTNRAELLTQAGGSFKRVGLNPYYIQAGIKTVSNTFNSYVAMSQTLRRRITEQYWLDFLKTIDLFIVDEIHIQEFNWLFELDFIQEKHVLGFTATPKRSGKMRQLGLDFESIIQTVDVAELIEMNYLLNDDYYGLANPNMSNVKIDHLSGDYKVSQMFSEFNNPKLYKGVVKNYLELTPNTKSLVFCVNIEHTIKTVIEFAEQGLDVRFLTSDVSKPKYPQNATDGQIARYNERNRIFELYEKNFTKYSGKRDNILEWFHNTKGAILVNAGILTTGFDEPTIETIILNRATISVTLLLQMIGRGSRLSENKTHFNILDFGGNCSRLGYYSEKRIWSLWHEQNVGKGIPPVKECGFDSDGKPIGEGGCRRLIMASYTICPICGFKYPEKKLKDIELSATAFDAELQRAIKVKRIKDMTNEELYTYWKIKKYKSAWLWRQLWYKGRERAIINFGNEYGWSAGTQRKAVEFCRNVL